MTIIMNVLVPEGIVVASDSRQVTQSLSGQLRVDSDNVQKIFKLSSHIAVSVVGQGTFYSHPDLSPRSISALVAAAAKQLPSPLTVKGAALTMQRQLKESLTKHQAITDSAGGGASLHIAGFDDDSDIGEVYRCEAFGNIVLERRTDDAGLVWCGQRETINRLVLGYDPRSYQLLEDSGAPLNVRELLGELYPKLQLHINFQTMPLQDAVDLAATLVSVTIEFSRFADGIVGMPGQFPTCGGSLQLAIVTPCNEVQWIHKVPLRC